MTVSSYLISGDILFCASLALNRLPPQELEGVPDFPYYRFLYWLSRLTKPFQIVECGVFKGHSLVCLAKGNSQAEVVGVDRDISNAVETVNTLPNVRLVISDSVSFLRTYLRSDFSQSLINLLHLDTTHTPDHVDKELRAAIPCMAPNGLICIDDIFISEEMREWWNGLGYTKVELPELHSTGYGVILT